MAQLKNLIVTGPSSFIGDLHCLGNNKSFKIGNANYSAGLHMGADGVYRGLYDFTLDKWMVYADATGVYLKGTADTASKADQFSGAATIKLTGDVTGETSSTKGWTISTTLQTVPITKGGTGTTSQTAKRAVRVNDSGNALISSGHYMSDSKMAINSTSEPTENLYVKGTLKTTGDTTIGGGASVSGNLSVSNKVAIGGALEVTGASTFTGLITANGGVKGNVTGNLIGNADTATEADKAKKWSATKAFKVTDVSGENAGTAVNVDGSADVTLKMPSTFKGNHTISGDLSITGTTSTSGNVSFNGSGKTFISNIDSSFVKNIKGNISAAHSNVTSGASGYHLIKILSTDNWMLAFTVRLYQAYTYTDIVISGYNYFADQTWYHPKATIIGSNGTKTINVVFGCSAANNLWVAIPAGNYYGIDIFNVTNGYKQVADYSNLFTISNVSSLPTSTPVEAKTITAYAPWYRGEVVSVDNGGTGNTAFTANRLIYSESTSKLSSSGHYSNATQLAVNSDSIDSSLKFFANGDSKVSGGLNVTGNTNIDNNLTVNGNTTLGDTNTDNTTIYGPLYKKGDSTNKGHIYLDGAASSSASNTTQIIFREGTTEHIALSSNNDCFVINPSSTSSFPQIALYLGASATSKIPGGLELGKQLSVGTTASITGATTIGGTLTLTKTQDLSGTANNSPALIIGGAATSTHMEIDCNEIQAKTNGTSVAALYLNNDGGLVTIGPGGLNVAGNTILGDAATDTTSINGVTTFGTTVTSQTTVTGGITIHDLRNSTPSSGMFGNKVANFYFDNTGPNSQWQSILHMNGWTASDYAAWELAGNSHTNNTAVGTLRYRVGLGTSWSDWHNVLLSDGSGKVAQKLYFKADSLAQSSSSTGLDYVCGINSFADGGELMWRSIGDLKVGKATADGDGNTISSTYLKLSGGTMTGQIKTSFKSSVAIGSYQPTAAALADICTELRYSSGCMGSVQLTETYSSTSGDITAGWYNFIYIPHRSGGNSGVASGDNCNYGTLFLIGMNNVYGFWRIRFNSSISQVTRVIEQDTAYTNLAYVKKSGDTMSGDLIISKASGTTQFKATRSDSGNSVSFMVGSGGVNRGVYDNNLSKWIIYSNGTNATTQLKLYGAVWNDYAEFRKTENIELGRIVVEHESGEMKLSSERLQAGANVTSDTFGFAIGQTEECKTPIAVAGRALVYPYEDRNSYPLGAAVCAAPGGTVSLMTREEIREWPDRIIGTVSEIPKYETWGEDNISVKGRIWIKIR